MMKQEKVDAIIDSHYNGQFSQMQRQVKSLSRLQIVELIMYADEHMHNEGEEFTRKLFLVLGGG